MFKPVKEVLANLKNDNVDSILTSKSAFNKNAFNSFVKSLANDNDHVVTIFDKNNEKQVSVAELLRNDVKKSAENAKYPQKSEAAVYDTSEIATDGLAEAASIIATEWLKTGRKLPLSPQKEFNATLFLKQIPGAVKESQIRDFKTNQVKPGKVVTTTKDSFRVAVKSPIPSHLKSKVTLDENGNEVK